MSRIRYMRNPIGALFVVVWAAFVFSGSNLEPALQDARLTAKPATQAKPPGVPPSNPGNPNPPSGGFALSNSKNGQPILTLTNVKPGASGTDTVTLTNSGALEGQVTLSKSQLQDTHPNCTACALSDALDLVVEDVTDTSQVQSVYSGKLGAMPTLQLGSLAKGQSKTYRFTVSFPDAGAPSSNTTGDNRYQGASTSVSFVWTASRTAGP